MKTSTIKFITCFIICTCVGSLIFSCGPSRRLTVNNGKKYYAESTCGNVKLKSYWLGSLVFIYYYLNGTYTLIPDSFKIAIRPNSYEIGSEPDLCEVLDLDFRVDGKVALPGEVIHSENPKIKITFYTDQCRYQDWRNEINSEYVIYPGNYIMCNDKPLITDTIIIDIRK